ncbi:hypothetical protein BDQ12DRAFT_670821 [Crucibulum laeve]|uniref:Uncharacterized protein n=1 Tax=Crucibulum laeve TaxID=68775 RepID=A0A5C3LJI1_9AGAR|nr:hypothetical protein BDQ12DRAFT_670821 [Crucibulum laeve]
MLGPSWVECTRKNAEIYKYLELHQPETLSASDSRRDLIYQYHRAVVRHHNRIDAFAFHTILWTTMMANHMGTNNAKIRVSHSGGWRRLCGISSVRTAMLLPYLCLLVLSVTRGSCSVIIASEIMLSLGNKITLDVGLAIEVFFVCCVTSLLLPFTVSDPGPTIDVLFVPVIDILDILDL